jgi:hypothetical protein
MANFYSPMYMLDLRSISNCSRIASVEPGEEIQVLVCPIADRTVEPILAKGRLSKDGVSFDVVITRADGAQQSYPVIYKNLKKALAF